MLGAKAANRQIELEPVSCNAGPAEKEAATALAAKAEAPASVHGGDTSDPILKRRPRLRRRLEDPPSVEFVEMKRAARKNTLGQPIDTICGYVKGKTSSDADVREMPFLYLVKEDEVYIVDGGADTMAAAAYSNICK